ncbi:Transcriptional regulator, GntR family [hydrothermal vent metagenome]|uniref:Transcriptional regulator, GntR family n=1 Tax=hydrothermal vent metagenome TaxID=652676 RepID=A0A3B1DRV7_9ZZZZ
MSLPIIIQPIREQIAEKLRHEVLSGQHDAGTPLRETDLANHFGVSRGPVRDALLQLTQEGLVVTTPNRGSRVAEVLSPDVHALIVGMRRDLEGLALRKIFDDLQEADFERFNHILSELKQACEINNVVEIVRHDLSLHRAIIERTGDSDLIGMWVPIVTRMHRMGYSIYTDSMEIYEEHAAIIDVFKQGDVDQAVTALQENIK